MSLIKNSTWNILGIAIPVLVAVPAMGYMARALGVERFGIFTLCYAVVGYASLFDVGLSRAVIRAVAISCSNLERIRKIIWTATTFVFFLSFLACSIMYFSSGWLVVKLSVSEGLHDETRRSFEFLSIAVPALLLSMVWFSYLEGVGDFFRLNLLKSLSGGAIALFPFIFVVYSPTLISAACGLVSGRLASMAIAYFWGLRGVGGFRFRMFDFSVLKELLRFGGWITVSNMISPIMSYFDRFYISSLTGAASAAFYSAPAEAVSKLLIFPVAVSKVLFPKLSAKHKDAEGEARMGFLLIGVVGVSLALFVGFFAKELMRLWVGDSYTGEAVFVLQILLIGFVFNSMAQVPFAKIQARGGARVTALVHFAELFPYLVILYFLVLKLSLVGAAIAWTIRVLIDFVILEFFSRRMH